MFVFCSLSKLDGFPPTLSWGTRGKCRIVLQKQNWDKLQNTEMIPFCALRRHRARSPWDRRLWATPPFNPYRQLGTL